MRVLLDTCVLAEIRKPDGNSAVKAAVAQWNDEELYLSVITMGEIAKGIRLLNNGKKKRSLEAWLSGLETNFGDRILPVDCEVARIWGEITAEAQKSGVTVPGMDGLIAATALCHGLHVMTRNTRHFQATHALVIDPWAD